MDRPAPFFQKRNTTRIVVRNRITRPPTTTTTTTLQPTEMPKVSRKTLRRKITRNPNQTTPRVQTTSTAKAQTAPTTTTTTTTKKPTTSKAYEQFSEIIDDEIAGVLPALTSAKPRKPLRPAYETTTRALQLPFNQLEKEQKFRPSPTSFEKILEHQYKIKGLDISSEETYEDDKLIGVLGSQVWNAVFLMITFLQLIMMYSSGQGHFTFTE